MTNENNALVAFESKEIRRVWFNDKWYFSVVDMVSILIDKDYQISRKHWNKLTERRRKEGREQTVTKCHQLLKEGSQVVTNCNQLKMVAVDVKTKLRKTRLKKEERQVVTNCSQLKMPAAGEKRYKTDAADIETMFRIIQSISSSKAELEKQLIH